MASETDAAGNIGTASLTFTLDTKAPAIVEGLATDTGSSSTDLITSNDTLTGSGDPNAVVHFTVDGNAIAGTATANASGVWTFTPTGLADGSHTIVASETDAAGNTGTTSLTFTLDTTAPLVVESVTNGNAPPPAAMIVDIVQQTARISGHRTVTTTVSGTSDAGDVVTLYEDTKVLGTATVDNAGQWSISLNNLSNTVHSFTAAATDTAGTTGPLSQVAILGTTGRDNIAGVAGGDTIIGNGAADNFTAGAGNDTFVFNPHFGKDTISNFDLNHDVLTFDPILFADAASVLSQTHDVNGNAVITFDRADTVTLVGITTAQLSANQNDIHIIGAPVVPNAPEITSFGTTAAVPNAPEITSFSPDSGIVGDGITNTTTLTLIGTAAANSVVTIFDGTLQLGTATVNGTGAWSFFTGSLSDATHSFSATDQNAGGNAGATSSAFTVTVDTIAPDAPVIATDTVVNTNQSNLTGTAEANSTVNVFEDLNQLGSTTVDANGTWSFTTGPLSGGDHLFTATATDAAGNTSAVSEAIDPTISEVGVTINGTSGADIIDATHGINGVFPTNGDDTINGKIGNDTIDGLGGNDVLTGGMGSDTFVFGSNFGKDVITDFRATGPNSDILQFSHDAFSDFAAVLAHAAQVGSDVVITLDAADTVTLQNVHLSSLQNNDFHLI